MYFSYRRIAIYPMIGDEFRFWLANSRELYTRTSRLTSSAREKNDIDDVTMVITTAVVFSCRCDTTECLQNELVQIKVISDILMLRKWLRMWQKYVEHGINSLPLVCFRGYGNLSTLYPSAARGIEMLRVNKFPQPSQQQGVSNIIILRRIVTVISPGYTLAFIDCAGAMKECSKMCQNQ